MKHLMLAALALLVLPTSGCSLFEDTIDPVYEIEDDEYLVVMPFKDPAFPRSAWDSPLGHEAALSTTTFLQRFAEFETVEYANVLELMYLPPADDQQEQGDDVGLDVRSLSEKEVGDLCGADYVLVVKILLWEESDPKNINMVRGTATAECKLFRVAITEEEIEDAEELTERELRMKKAREAYNLADGGEVAVGGAWVDTSTVTAHYPDDYLNQYGSPFMDKQTVRGELILRLADKVAKLYYEHDVEDDFKGSGS
jgi:hypothetical protein